MEPDVRRNGQKPVHAANLIARTEQDEIRSGDPRDLEYVLGQGERGGQAG